MSTYYFISDLHIGGDEALGTCDFEPELISFLDSLAPATCPASADGESFSMQSSISSPLFGSAFLWNGS